MGVARIKERLWVYNPSANKRCINGNVLRKLNLGSFAPMLLYADGLHNVLGNPEI
jgi:hypothetical protein